MTSIVKLLNRTLSNSTPMIDAIETNNSRQSQAAAVSRALLAAVICSLLASPLEAVSTPQKQPAAAATAEISPAIINLGAVGHQRKEVINFEVTNTGDSPLVFQKAETSCSCMKLSFATTPLSAGAARKGSVTVNFGRGYGKFDKYVKIELDGGAQLRMRVMAQFHPDVDVEGNSFTLHSSLSKRLPESRGSVTIQCKRRSDALRIEDLRVNNPVVTATLQPSDSQTSRIVVEIAPNAPKGPIRAQITCTVQGLTMMFPVNGEVHSGIRPIPNHFNFSRIDKPDSAEAVVELIGIDGTFEILEVRVEEQEKLSSATITVQVERQGDNYRLLARPKKPEGGWPVDGRLAGSVIVETDNVDCPQLQLRYFGFFPKPAKAPAK